MEDNIIDFPCSRSWREYYQETMYGEYPLEIPERVEREEPRFQDLRPIKAEVNHLLKKLVTLEDRLKKNRTTYSIE